ncbi:MAG: hypothetical protein IIA67_14360 [Planctomycetes bacterium]|nr:hypothetical protein [Planctomycetota bacterium]
MDGQYSVSVRATAGTTGAYVLRVTGHTGLPPQFTVSGSTFDGFAGTLTVDFNRPLSLDSLQPGDLQVNGQPARRFDIVDGQRVRFTLPQLSILAGDMSMSIDAGAIEDLAGNPITEFSTNFSRPLIPLPPLGSLFHAQGVGGQISAAGTTQQFLLELDASQFVSLLLAPSDGTLRPTLQLIPPVGEPQSFEATAPGEILLTPPIDIESAGAYTVVVGGADNTTGFFSLQAIVNGLLEDELLFNSSNDLIADAQDIDAGFIDLNSAGAGQRAGTPSCP